MTSSRLPHRGLALSLALVALIVGWIFASQPTTPETSTAVDSAADLTVQVDPEHGIVPRTHQSEPVETGSMIGRSKSSADIEIVEHPSGMRSAVLDERFMSTSVARIDADGGVVTDCFDTPEEAQDFLQRERDASGLEVR